MNGLPWTVRNRTELKAGFGKINFCSLKLAKKFDRVLSTEANHIRNMNLES